MSRFIKRRVEVDDPGYSEVYSPGSGHVVEFRLAEDNVFFIGLRGSGKSSLARMVAEKIGGTCVDSDDLVTNKAGSLIADYVTEHGWDAFRRLEQDCLQELCGRKGQIVATGGGIVLLPENRSLLKEHGRVFYLQASVPLLAARLTKEPETSRRPELSELPLEEELAQTLRQRESLYFECLDYILQAEKTLEALADDVLTMLKPGRSVYTP